MKKLKLLKTSKGVTLMELVVAMLVFAILMMTVTAILTPMLRTYYRAVDFAETNPLLDEISNKMLADINQANSVQVDTAANTLTLTIKRPGQVAYTVIYDHQPIDGVNNVLHRTVSGVEAAETTVPVYDPHFYEGNYRTGNAWKTVTVRYSTDAAGETALALGSVDSPFYVNISINGAGNQINRTYAVNPLCI